MIVQRNWLNLADSWLSGFQHRIPFYYTPLCVHTIANGGVAQTDIPVVIFIGSSLGDGDKRNTDLTRVFDELESDWQKMAITTDDGITQCYISICEWDDVNQKGVLWFKAPSIGRWSADDSYRLTGKFYLYYDRGADDNTTYVGEPGDSPSNTVWSDFEWGFMFQEAPVDNVRTLIDFVSKGTQDGKWVGSVTGKHLDFVWGNNEEIKKCLDFESGDTDYVTYAASEDFYPLDAATLVVLQDTETRSNNTRILSYSSGAGNDKVWEMGINSGGHWFCDFYNNNAAIAAATDVGDAIGNGKELITFTYNGGSDAGDCELFRSTGTSVATGTPTGAAIGNPPGAPSAPLIGVRQGGWGWWDGKIAFAAMANIAVDKNWIAILFRGLANNLWHFMETEEKPSEEFQYRLPIHVKPDNVDSDLNALNLKIFLGASVGDDGQDVTAVFDEIGDQARKIRITESDGMTVLPCEVIYWDAVGEFAVLSTAVEFIDATNGLHLFLYYGGGMPDCGETVYTAEVTTGPVTSSEHNRLAWHASKRKPNYPTVYPFEEAINVGIEDMNDIDTQLLVNLDDNDLAVDSDYGPYVDIADGEWIAFPDLGSVDRTITNAFTLEAFLRIPVEMNSEIRILCKRDSQSPYAGYELFFESSVDGFRITLDIGATASAVRTVTVNVDDNSWHHLVSTYDGSDTIGGLNIYLDGALDRAVVADNFPMGGSMTNSKEFQIGARDGAQQASFQFQIIEGRYYAEEFGADKIKFQNQNYKDGLLCFDSVEEKSTFDDLAPAVVQYDDVAVKWIGYPTVFIEHSALAMEYVPGVHTVFTQAALALIGSATGSKPGTISASGGAPGLTGSGQKPKIASVAGAKPGIASATGKVIP